MLLLQPGVLLADDGTTMALSLNAGESYIINNVSPGATPAVNVITNPHALVVHNEEPGKVVLLGAEAGEWTVAVKTTDGSTIKYDVTVKSTGSAFDINNPGKAPAAITGSGASVGTAAPVVAKMDEGTGPVASASAPASSSPRRRLLRRHLEALRLRRIRWPRPRLRPHRLRRPPPRFLPLL